MLYPIGLEAGLDAMRFWDMTYFEIKEHIKAYAKRNKESMREKAILSYNHAHLIAQLVGISFSGEGKVPQLHDIYPSLFDAPELQGQQQDWRIMKARIEAYSLEMRKRGDKANGDNC